MKDLYELFVNITLVLLKALLTRDKFVTVRHRNIHSLAIKIFKIEQTQPAITCSKLTIETLEQGVKYVQS